MRMGYNFPWNIFWTLAAASPSRLISNHRGQYPRLVHSFSIHSTNNHRRIPQWQQERWHQLLSTSGRTTMSASLKSSDLSALTSDVRFVDIGANLLDERYTDGIYYGKKRHEPDFDLVLERALEQGVTHVILTAGTLKESRKALSVVESYRRKWESQPPLFLGCTVGVHPTRCQQEFVDNLLDEETPNTAEDILNELANLLSHGFEHGYVVAIGEFGLDYDRLEFSPKDVQIDFFRRQLDCFLYGENPDIGSLPLFLHNRSVGRDLLEILLENRDRIHPKTQQKVPIRGVVHSFDDSWELAQAFIDLGLYIGLNGCSLKTEENLEVVKKLPLDRILLETDCPYCEIKATHAGHKYIQTTFAGRKKADKKFEAGKMVKGRNEPCQIIQVAEVIAGTKGISLEEVAEACYRNSMELYGGFSRTTPARID